MSPRPAIPSATRSEAGDDVKLSMISRLRAAGHPLMAGKFLMSTSSRGRFPRGCRPPCPECPDWYVLQLALLCGSTGRNGANGSVTGHLIGQGLASAARLLPPVPLVEVEDAPNRCARCRGPMIRVEVDLDEPLRCLLCGRPPVAPQPEAVGARGRRGRPGGVPVGAVSRQKVRR